MHHITGAPRLTAQGHELMARTYARQAEEAKASASAEPDEAGAEFWRRAAAHDVGVSAGHAFRAAELRYDARGGLTAEQARRRFEPGAVWSRYGVRLVVAFQSYFQGEAWAHFPFRQPEELAAMTRENGWRLVALAPAATGDDST